MAIAVDKISNGTDGGTTQITVPHTVDSVAGGGILIVTVQVTDASETDRIIQTVTHNNEALTHLPADSDDDIEQRTEIWFRENPTTGGIPNIVVTATASCTDLTLGAISLTGVNTNIVNDYYFNDSTPVDGNGVCTDDTNAFDDDDTPSTYAHTNDHDAFYPPANDFLSGTGTTAPTSGDDIAGVAARIYGGDNTASTWGEWAFLDIPSGGWTWSKVNGLEARVYFFSISDDLIASIWDGGDDLSAIRRVKVEGTQGDTPYRVYRVELRVFTNIVLQTAEHPNTGPPTLSITTEGDSSYVIDSLAIAEADGTKITPVHTSIHKTDVGGDTHASQYVDAGGAGAQTMNYTDTDSDKSWVLSAVAVQVADGAPPSTLRRYYSPGIWRTVDI